MGHEKVVPSRPILYIQTHVIGSFCKVVHTRLRTKLSRAVPLWNRTERRVVVVEMRRPTFLLITTHRDSRI